MYQKKNAKPVSILKGKYIKIMNVQTLQKRTYSISYKQVKTNSHNV